MEWKTFSTKSQFVAIPRFIGSILLNSKESNKRKDCIKLLNIILQTLLSWFAPILSFTTEEIYQLVNKDDNSSIHLKKFVKIPKSWKNEKLNERWKDLIKIRDISNISIEGKRAQKIIGSSLEAKINIKLNQKLYDIAKNFDLAELCITSEAELVKDDNISDDVVVETEKAEGEKCKVCWKIKKGKCERHGI